MLVCFEGQDGAGKTTLLEGVGAGLRGRGIDVVTVEEFSASSYGDRLIDALAADKFLRPVAGQDATAVTRAFDIVADLHYLDARVIAPELARGAVVLKDRHVDTVLYTLPPSLVDAGVFADQGAALAWLRALVAPLRFPPTLTVYVDAPLDVRLCRIGARVRSLTEDRANLVSDGDIRVFQARDEIARSLIATEPERFLVIDNGGRPLGDAVRDVVDGVVARMRPVA